MIRKAVRQFYVVKMLLSQMESCIIEFVYLTCLSKVVKKNFIVSKLYIVLQRISEFLTVQGVTP